MIIKAMDAKPTSIMTMISSSVISGRGGVTTPARAKMLTT